MGQKRRFAKAGNRIRRDMVQEADDRRHGDVKHESPRHGTYEARDGERGQRRRAGGNDTSDKTQGLLRQRAGGGGTGDKIRRARRQEAGAQIRRKRRRGIRGKTQNAARQRTGDDSPDLRPREAGI